MQNLGYTAECSVSAFETQVEEITSYISQKISQVEPLDDDDVLKSLYGTSQCSKTCQLKVVYFLVVTAEFISFCSSWNVPTILQSLGCITQWSVSDLGSQVEEITSYICQKIIQMECLDDDYQTSLNDTSQCSKSCQLKYTFDYGINVPMLMSLLKERRGSASGGNMLRGGGPAYGVKDLHICIFDNILSVLIYGLKTLVKSFLPDRQNQTTRNISGLLDILSRMLRESDVKGEWRREITYNF
ncbi:hypothetical protein TSUD_13040 [Trifolium subterraneum]|uniref:Uncharacterized protein n=1 Tax=Trifolium subterraneum TaxID=3900 RepID=A0A2Z6NQV6_TRISU|nr:hypothetical protein TSUD_13040 [Trifolium subterraneum]